jgi:hypothetical protein
MTVCTRRELPQADVGEGAHGRRAAGEQQTHLPKGRGRLESRERAVAVGPHEARDVDPLEGAKKSDLAQQDLERIANGGIGQRALSGKAR